jgi:glycosyltransferase involved in cell wall biosynthesis
VDPSTPQAFADAASGILADPLLAERLATAAVVRARRYTWAQSASLLRATYEELTAERLVDCR